MYIYRERDRKKIYTTNPNPTVTTARTVVEPRPVRAGVSWPLSVFTWNYIGMDRISSQNSSIVFDREDCDRGDYRG